MLAEGVNHASHDRSKHRFAWTGVGQMVSLLAFYSDNASSNPIKVYRLNAVNCLKRNK